MIMIQISGGKTRRGSMLGLEFPQQESFELDCQQRTTRHDWS